MKKGIEDRKKIKYILLVTTVRNRKEKKERVDILFIIKAECLL